MPRNIVICCDGTNNQFGVCNTSVVRLTQTLKQNPATQIVYYDPGVGTMPAPAFGASIAQRLSRWIALAFGTDLEAKVLTAYAHLMEVYQPGDRLFLFGFSRGAYTARVLAGLLYSLGLLHAGNAQLLPYIMRLFRGTPSARDSHAYWHVLDKFRWSFARDIPDRHDQRCSVHFMGMWDTVSSVGWIWDPATYPFTSKNPGVAAVRHAVSLDERRFLFRQNLVTAAEEQDLLELWFPGVHSDVGGGYPENEGGLWREPFEWLMGEAELAGLDVDRARLHEVLNTSPPPQHAWKEPAHESLHGRWWLAEVFPKLVYDRRLARRRPSLGLGRHRYVHDGALLHHGLLARLRGTEYTPPNLTKSFIKAVKGMSSLPSYLPYASSDNSH
jgi:uncharacterized protein (DUF2235 family)